MKLRDYQEAAATGVFNAWNECTSALAVLPTGLGKTVLFAEIIRRMHERGCRAMVLAHREELITQAADYGGQVGHNAWFTPWAAWPRPQKTRGAIEM